MSNGLRAAALTDTHTPSYTVENNITFATLLMYR